MIDISVARLLELITLFTFSRNTERKTTNMDVGVFSDDDLWDQIDLNQFDLVRLNELNVTATVLCASPCLQSKTFCLFHCVIFDMDYLTCM